MFGVEILPVNPESDPSIDSFLFDEDRNSSPKTFKFEISESSLRIILILESIFDVWEKIVFEFIVIFCSEFDVVVMRDLKPIGWTLEIWGHIELMHPNYE